VSITQAENWIDIIFRSFTEVSMWHGAQHRRRL